MNRLLSTLGAAACALMVASCTTQPAPGAKVDNRTYPANFRVVGYFPSWSGLNPDTFNFHLLTHVNWAFLTPQTNGTVGDEEHAYKLTQFVKLAHDAGTKVLISVGGWLGDSPDCQLFVDIGATPETSSKFAASCMALVHKYNVDGIDIDWEFPQTDGKKNYANVITALATVLHAEGKLLSIAVSPDSKNVNAVALKAVDYVNIMAYDAPAGEGKPHSSREFAQAAVDYWKVTRQVPGQKLNLGVPFYARKDDNWNSDYSYRSLVQDDPAAAQKDDSEGYNYNGIPTIQWKTKYALANIGGIMIWELSQDSPDDNSLLKAIFDSVAVTPAGK